MESKGKNTNFFTVCVALVVLQAGFGAYGVIYTKLAKGTKVDPLIFCFYRDGGCAPVLFVVSYFLEKKLLVPQVRELPLLIFLGFTGIFLGQLFYILGLINTTPDTASMFTPLVPVICSVLAVVFHIEPVPQCTRTGLAKILGIIIAVAGALIMTRSKQKNRIKDKYAEKATSFGLMCMLCHLNVKAVWILSQKKFIFQNMNSRFRELPINLTAWSYFFGSIWMGFASFMFVTEKEKYHIKSVNVIYCLIYAIFVTSALCYVLITWCNKQANPSFVIASWVMHVLFTVTFSYIVLGETLNFQEIFGGILIILALMVVTWSNFQEDESQALVLTSKSRDFDETKDNKMKSLLSNMWTK